MKNSNVLTKPDKVFIGSKLLTKVENNVDVVAKVLAGEIPLKVFNNSNDAIVIITPGRPKNVERMFIGENQWGRISMNEYIAEKVAYLALYETSPISAIRSFACIESIELFIDGYVIKVRPPVELSQPIELIPNGKVKAPQNRSYYYLEGLLHAKTMDNLDGYRVPVINDKWYMGSGEKWHKVPGGVGKKQEIKQNI